MKHTSVALTDKVVEIIESYRAENDCTCNKAINDLILMGNENKDLMKYIKAIYKNTKK